MKNYSIIVAALIIAGLITTAGIVQSAPVETIKYNTILMHTERTETVTITEYTRDFRLFESLEQLEAWAYESRVKPTPETNGWNCVDYALEFQRRALEDGWIISYESVLYSEYNFYFNGDSEEGNHAICSTFIEPVMYLIEPISGEVAKKWDRSK